MKFKLVEGISFHDIQIDTDGNVTDEHGVPVQGKITKNLKANLGKNFGDAVNLDDMDFDDEIPETDWETDHAVDQNNNTEQDQNKEKEKEKEKQIEGEPKEPKKPEDPKEPKKPKEPPKMPKYKPGKIYKDINTGKSYKATLDGMSLQEI